MSREYFPIAILLLFISLCLAPSSSVGQENGSGLIGEVTGPTVKNAQPEKKAAASLHLSVEQAVMLALQNNRDLQVQQLEPVITGSFEMLEAGRFDPELFAEFEAFKEQASETSRSSGDQFSVSAREATGSVGLRQLFPTGTEIEAGISQNRSASNRAPEQQTARIGLTMTQSLLRDFGPTVNLASIRQAELETLASIAELRGFSEALLADSETAYWNYVLAGKEISIYEESLKVARQQLEEIELRIEVGILPEIEAAAARAEEALRVQALIDARSKLEEARLHLLRLINPDLNGNLMRPVVVTSEPDLVTQPLLDLDDRLQLAEASRSELKEARLRQEQNRLETVMTRNGLLPQLELFISLGKTGYADSFSDSFRSLDGNTFDLSGGLRLSFLLGNRQAEARNIAAFAARRQADAALANLHQLVQLDVHRAFNEVERVRQQITASRATRNYRQQTLAAEQERFEVGSSTALQVSQAQRDLLNSQIAEIEAIVNYRIALVRLYLVEGSLLERRGISIAAG